MKKYIISLVLVFTMVFGTAAAFAETGAVDENAAQDVAVTDVDAAAEGAVPAEDADAQEPETPAGTVLTAQDAEKPAGTVLTAQDAEEPEAEAEEPAAEKTLQAQELSAQEETIENGWDSNHEHYYENNVVKTGLFKAKMWNDVGALFYADETGLVKKTEGFVPVAGTEVRYLMQEDSGGHKGFTLAPPTDTNSYTYYFKSVVYGEHVDYVALEKPGIIDAADGKYCLQDNCTVRTAKGVADVANFGRAYLQDGGKIQTAEGIIQDGGYSYIVQSGGKIATEVGFKTTGGKKYFVADKYGHLKTSEGFQEVSGKRYYVAKGGVVKTTGGWLSYAGKRYLCNSDGSVYTKAGACNYGGKTYLIKADASVDNVKGFRTINGKKYYILNSTGELAKNKTVKTGGKYYHILSSGQVAVGPHKWKSGTYLSSKSGVVHRKKSKSKYNGKYYFTSKSGKIYLNKKFKYKKKYYIANKKGVLQKGLFTWKKALYYGDSKYVIRTKKGILKLGKLRYFVRKGGKIYTDQKFRASGKTFFAEEDGHLRIGVFKWTDGKYYYTNDYGAMQTRAAIIKYDGKRYYNKSGGGLLTDDFFEYGGKFYHCGTNAVISTSPFVYKGTTVRPNSKTGEIDEDVYYTLFPEKKPKDQTDDE